MVDNVSYHVSSQSGDLVKDFVTTSGGEYRRLPKYSPELNPIELVWRWLKDELHCEPIDGDLVEAINSILGRIPVAVVIAAYRECGWIE